MNDSPKFLPWLEILREEAQRYYNDRAASVHWFAGDSGLCFNTSRIYRLAVAGENKNISAMKRQRDELMMRWFYDKCEELGFDCDVAEPWEDSAVTYPVESVMRVAGYTTDSPISLYNYPGMYEGMRGSLRLSLLDYIIEHWQE